MLTRRDERNRMMVWVTAVGCGGGGGGGNARGVSWKHCGLRWGPGRHNSSKSGKERGMKEDWGWGWWLRSRYKNAFEQTERWGQPLGAALPIQGRW